MHPSEPWEEELENVPTGHGRKNQKSSFCSGVRVNPDASRAEIQTFPFSDLGRGTAIDSVSDKYGFLKRILQEKKRKEKMKTGKVANPCVQNYARWKKFVFKTMVCFLFSVLMVFGRKMTSQVWQQNFNFDLWYILKSMTR